MTPPPAGDLAGVRRELLAGDAAAPCDPARHGTRLPAAIDGATLLYPYHTERASWFYVLAAKPHQLLERSEPPSELGSRLARAASERSEHRGEKKPDPVLRGRAMATAPTVYQL